MEKADISLISHNQDIDKDRIGIGMILPCIACLIWVIPHAGNFVHVTIQSLQQITARASDTDSHPTWKDQI